MPGPQRLFRFEQISTTKVHAQGSRGIFHLFGQGGGTPRGPHTQRRRWILRRAAGSLCQEGLEEGRDSDLDADGSRTQGRDADGSNKIRGAASGSRDARKARYPPKEATAPPELHVRASGFFPAVASPGTPHTLGQPRLVRPRGRTQRQGPVAPRQVHRSAGEGQTADKTAAVPPRGVAGDGFPRRRDEARDGTDDRPSCPQGHCRGGGNPHRLRKGLGRRHEAAQDHLGVHDYGHQDRTRQGQGRTEAAAQTPAGRK
mmetsp:Transcript_107963/g.220419  ORF Transcript_107963/g.220419 Transcript_107963/m.220419 type:complete len:258 (+) Transcript_107963:68-841(+)